MLVVYPSYTHPVYLEWKKWRTRLNNIDHSKESASDIIQAMNSIESIAEHLYPGVVIVGRMIMMMDLEEMDASEEDKHVGRIC